MAIPNPPKALDGTCSTVWNNTLYVLSSDSFQSVALSERAQWKQETLGKAVNGAACAKVQQGNDASSAQLWVIGGSSDDTNYSGVQRYNFVSKSWEQLPIPVPDMRNRQNHTAIYMPADNKVLVYAGSIASAPQEYSSQTFTILATPPYTIDSFINRGHTANRPILDTWDATRVFMTGGSSIEATNFLFDTTNGWTRYGTGLLNPIPREVRGVLVQGADGSKILQTYDARTSPNKVSSVVIQRADGSPAENGQYLSGSPAKRDLTAAGWPAYQAANAPAITRSDFAVTTNGQGLVVLTGGNAQTPISLFDQNQNGWVDAANFFKSDPSQAPLVQSSSAAASRASTATSAPASTAATSASSPTATVGTVPANVVDDAAARQSAQLRTQLGIVLGVLAAIFLFFIVLMLWLRARKKKQDQGSSYVNNGEGGRMSFADRGASFMKEAGGSQNNFYPTADRYSVSQRMSPFNSQTNVNNNRGMSGAYKGYGHKQKGSYESTKELVEKDSGYHMEPVEMTPVHGKKSPVIRKPAATYQNERTAALPTQNSISAAEDEKDRRKRSSGWSRYFATSQPPDESLAHLPSAYRKDPAYTSVYSQAPSLPALPAQIPSASLMPPLSIDFTTTLDGQRLSKVASSNPSYFNSQDSRQADAAKIEDTERPSSLHTTTSSFDDRATMSSNADYYARPQEAWTPMTNANSFKDHTNHSDPVSRRASSTYTASVYGERPRSKGQRGQGSFFPGPGTLGHSKNASKGKLTYSAAPSADWGSLNDENMDSLKQALNSRDTMHSTVTVFPEPMPDGNGYTATTRQPSQKSTKSTKSAKSVNGSGMAGLTRSATNDKSSNMTLFPRTVEIKQFPGAKAAQGKTAQNTDVSWVNLESR